MTFDRVFDLLDEAQLRYVVVGGVATVMHGYVRYTADLDLVVDFDPLPLHRALELLEPAFHPFAPVPLHAFADRANRQRWREEKNMLVFSIISNEMPPTTVDLFLDHPIEFEELWNSAAVMRRGASEVRVAGIEQLIEMKRQAGREKDLLDISELEAIRNERLREGDDELRDRADMWAQPGEWLSQEAIYRRVWSRATPAERLLKLDELRSFAATRSPQE